MWLIVKTVFQALSQEQFKNNLGWIYMVSQKRRRHTLVHIFNKYPRKKICNTTADPATLKRVATLPCERNFRNSHGLQSHTIADHARTYWRKWRECGHDRGADEEDETQIRHSTHPVAQFTVIWIIFRGDLGLKWRLLKVWLKQSVMQH